MSDTLTPERLAKLRAWRIAVGKAASFLRFQSAYGDHSHIVKQEYSEVAATLAEVDALLAAEAERDAALAEVARLKAKLDFLKAKGITVGPMQSSDRAEPYLAYVISPDSELDDTKTISRLTDAEIENTRLRNLLARVEVDERWRPIETAPKDGSRLVITSGSGFPAIARWSRSYGWWMVGDTQYFDPTHWRPLPLSPADEAELDALRQAVAMEGETP